MFLWIYFITLQGQWILETLWIIPKIVWSLRVIILRIKCIHGYSVKVFQVLFICICMLSAILADQLLIPFYIAHFVLFCQPKIPFLMVHSYLYHLWLCSRIWDLSIGFLSWQHFIVSLFINKHHSTM